MAEPRGTKRLLSATNTAQHPDPSEQQTTVTLPTLPATNPSHTATIPQPPATNTGTHFPGRSLLGAKKQRQSTLAPTKPKTHSDPKMDPQRIFQQPTKASVWFQVHFTGVHSESGIARWFGSIKGISEKQKTQIKQYLELVATEFPSLTDSQQQSLQTAAIAWGVPPKAIEKFATPALVKLVAIISQMTE